MADSGTELTEELDDAAAAAAEEEEEEEEPFASAEMRGMLVLLRGGRRVSTRIKTESKPKRATGIT